MVHSRTRPVAAALLLLFALSACVGTGRSRLEASQRTGRDFFGWPLYDSVAEDVDVIVTGGSRPKATSLERAFAYPSLLVDLVLDTVLLPLDVIGGIYGMDKRPKELREGDRRPVPLPRTDR